MPATPTAMDRSKLLSFDVETTGPDPATARVVTAALVHVDGAAATTSTWLADPGMAIPPEATAIHGITTEMARSQGQDHGQVIAEVCERIRAGWRAGYTLVVFNAPFDLTIVSRFDASFRITGPVLDPYVVDRHIDQFRRGKRSLTALCEHYKVVLDDAHNAAADALAAARLAWLLAPHEELAVGSWEELNDLQAGWYAQRQRDLAAYFERIGKTSEPVNTKWPIAR